MPWNPCHMKVCKAKGKSQKGYRLPKRVEDSMRAHAGTKKEGRRAGGAHAFLTPVVQRTRKSTKKNVRTGVCVEDAVR